MSEDRKPSSKLVRFPSASHSRRRAATQGTEPVQHAKEIEVMKQAESAGRLAKSALERKLLQGRSRTRTFGDVSLTFEIAATSSGYWPVVILDTDTYRRARFTFGLDQAHEALVIFDALEAALRSKMTLEIGYRAG